MAAAVNSVVPTVKVFEQTARPLAPGLTANTQINACNLTARPTAPGETVHAILENHHQTARRPAPGEMYRFSDLPCLQNDSRLRGRVAAFLAGGDRVEEMKDALEEWVSCKCKLHNPVICGLAGGPGCAGLAHGEHSALRGLYGANHTACVVEAGVRKRDRQFFDYVEFPTGPVVPVRKKYMAGAGTAPERMGAGYCYTHWFPDEVVVRVARLLGPQPYLHRVLRYFLQVGKRGPITAFARVVEGGVLHVERTSGGCVTPGMVIRFILRHGPNDRVGQEGVDDAYAWCGLSVLPSQGYVNEYDRQRFIEMKEWCAGLGVHVPAESVVDFAYATQPVAWIAVEEEKLRARVHAFKSVGELFMKMSGSLLTLTSGGAHDIRRWETACTNAALAEATVWQPLASLLQCGSLLPKSKARADLVKALFGVLFVYCGPSASICLGVIGFEGGHYHARECVEVARPCESVATARAASVIADFQLRGGSVTAMRKAVDDILSGADVPAAADQPARSDG